MSWFPSRMERLDVIVANQHRDELMSRLHEAGIAELRDVKHDEDMGEFLSRPESHNLQKDMENLLSRTSRISTIIERSAPQKPEGIGAMLSPHVEKKILIKKRPVEKIMKDARTLLECVEKPLLKVERNYEDINHEIESIKAKSHALSTLSEIDIELSHVRRGPFTFVAVGTTSDTGRIAEGLGPFNCMLRTSPVSENLHAVVVVGTTGEEKSMMTVLKSAGFSHMDLTGLKGNPKQAMADLDKRVQEKKRELQRITGYIRGLGKRYMKNAHVLHEELEIELERVHAVQKAGRTSSVHVLSMWCPSKEKKTFQNIVHKTTGGTGMVHTVESNEEPPAKMENPGWSKPFEMLTNMYGVPGYSEIDPTKIIAPVFIIFFGLMLGDAVYGLIVAFAGVLILRASGDDASLRDFSIILLLSGLSAVFFGMIQGGYLGPVMENQSNLVMLFGLSPPVLLDAMTDPITLLVIALLIGLAYINLGLFLAAVQNIKKKQPKMIILEQAPWWLLQPAGFILLGDGLFGWWDFTALQTNLGIVMALSGTGLLVVSKKGLFFFDITGFLGNFLSFARILALGLATAGIALTINVIVGLVAGASMDIGMLAFVILGVSIPMTLMGVARKKTPLAVGGFILLFFGGSSLLGAVHLFFITMAVFMYVVAHIMNCGLQTLGAFIHSLRLQYVEFFGLFFEGSGRPFKPFQPERKRTILAKEERT